MSEDFLDFVSDFFSIDKKYLNKKTRLNTLERDVHDRILFTFEMEKHFKIELEEEELIKLNKLGDYQALLEKKLQLRSEKDFIFKRAA